MTMTMMIILSSLLPLFCFHTVVVVESFLIPTKSTTTVRNSKLRRPELERTHWCHQLCPPEFFSSILLLSRQYRRDYDDDDDDYNNNQEGEDYDDEDDEEPPEVDIRNFAMPTTSVVLGLGHGRSSPSQRKAMGTSSKGSTQVYLCTNCGAESAVWRGKCPTCQEWNSFQPFQVPRSTSVSGSAAHSLLMGRQGRPNFGSNNINNNNNSWLDGISTFGINGNNYPISISNIDLSSNQQRQQRLQIPDDDEFNQVLGGGLVPGSLLLLGGDPGVGKSTLALQIASQIASLSPPLPGIGMGPAPSPPAAAAAVPNHHHTNVGPVWYVSGEETLHQIATRAAQPRNNDNKNIKDSLPSQLYLLAETHLNTLVDQVVQIWMRQPQQQQQQRGGGDNLADYEDPLHSQQHQQQQQTQTPSLIVVDSIQTMICDAGGSSSAGGIVQVRECMALLLRLAKTTNIPILCVGHVTKSGDVAGPRTVEHMVDVVLYLEHHQHLSASSSSSSALANSNFNYRWLRAQKNRFGSCQTVGLYQFLDHGWLQPQPDGMQNLFPPATDMEGCAFSIGMEGSQRAMTVEVQALVTLASSGFSKKTVEGIPLSRLNLVLGILQKHCQLNISGSSGGGNNRGGGTSRDVYVNVVGGMSKSQQTVVAPTLDLAVAVALTSSFVNIPVRGDTVLLAQVGLLGELRPISSLEVRLKQAQRMGFSRAIVAGGGGGGGQRRMNPTKRGQQEKRRGNESWSTSRQYDMDILECSKVQDALNLALVAKLPSPRRSKRPSATQVVGGTLSPATIKDLYLEEEIILDDEEDDLDDY